MGAITDSVTAYGKTAREAFEALYAEAIYDHGHNPYSGSIATCELGKADKLDQSKFTEAAIDRWLDKRLYDCPKREAVYLELPKSFAKGQGRGVKAYLFVYCAAC